MPEQDYDELQQLNKMSQLGNSVFVDKNFSFTIVIYRSTTPLFILSVPHECQVRTIYMWRVNRLIILRDDEWIRNFRRKVAESNYVKLFIATSTRDLLKSLIFSFPIRPKIPTHSMPEVIIIATSLTAIHDRTYYGLVLSCLRKTQDKKFLREKERGRGWFMLANIESHLLIRNLLPLPKTMV